LEQAEMLVDGLFTTLSPRVKKPLVIPVLIRNRLVSINYLQAAIVPTTNLLSA
jgi:hypothetical protein